MPLKIVTWNVEYANRLLKDTSAAANNRKERIKKTLEEINPDIICLVEGPKGENGAIGFGASVLDNGWEPVLLRGPNDAAGKRDRDYANNMNGIQWIWFYVRPAIRDRCRLQEPAAWQELTGCDSWGIYLWGRPNKRVLHKHYRHPQVLVYEFENGEQMELIGVHLKSGFQMGKPVRDDEGNLLGEYLDTALENRIKLATEARDVRAYIRERFARSEKPPAIIILGDANDGAAQDYFESNYLFFSIISNLEGDVTESEQYFNHALFDFDPDLRWSIRFNDPVTGLSAAQNPLLLDHILMSQPLCGMRAYPLFADRHSGCVEHEAWQSNNPKGSIETSDHRPVSLTLTEP